MGSESNPCYRYEVDDPDRGRDGRKSTESKDLGRSHEGIPRQLGIVLRLLRTGKVVSLLILILALCI